MLASESSSKAPRWFVWNPRCPVWTWSVPPALALAQAALSGGVFTKKKDQPGKTGSRDRLAWKDVAGLSTPEEKLMGRLRRVRAQGSIEFRVAGTHGWSCGDLLLEGMNSGPERLCVSPPKRQCLGWGSTGLTRAQWGQPD